MNWALSPSPPPPAPHTPCLSADPCSLRKGALSPPLSCLTLEDAPLWTWLPSSLKKSLGTSPLFRLLAGVGLGPGSGSNPSPVSSHHVTLREWQKLACPPVSRALPEAVTLPNASHGCGPKNPVRVCRTPARPSSVLGTWRGRRAQALSLPFAVCEQVLRARLAPCKWEWEVCHMGAGPGTNRVGVEEMTFKCWGCMKATRILSTRRKDRNLAVKPRRPIDL